MDHEGIRKSSKKAPRTPKRQASSDHSDGLASGRYSGLWECYHDTSTKETTGDRENEENTQKLRNIRGYLLRRRKAPLKGWQKRYFVLEKGFMICSRSPSHLEKDKLVCSIDMGTAVVSFRSDMWKIDIDGEHQVLHLKAKNSSHFSVWASCLQEHQQMRQAFLVGGVTTEPLLSPLLSSSQSALEEWRAENNTKLADVRAELSVVQENLNAMTQHVHLLRPSSSSISNFSSTSDSSKGTPLEGTDTPSLSLPSSDNGQAKKKKGRKKLEKKSKESMQAPSEHSHSSSVLDDLTMLDITLEEGFTVNAKTVYAQLCEVVEKLQGLESSFRRAAEREVTISQQMQTIMSNHRLLLQQSITQNSSLRERLQQISALATGVPQAPPPVDMPQTPLMARTPLDHGSYSSSRVKRYDSFMSVRSTFSESFYDAQEQLQARSSDSDEQGENSNPEESMGEEDEEEQIFSSFNQQMMPLVLRAATPGIHNTPSPGPTYIPEHPSPSNTLEELKEEEGMKKEEESAIASITGHRTRLPAPTVDTGDLSLWSLLRKNIGKDLSKISMPVALNEPLSALQRLSEELQYCDLINQAANIDDCYDRMVHIAAFAVSAYNPYFHRAGRKPFNPILGETYEYVDELQGLKFIAEQVSHHPPIAACHCHSPHFTFWQDARIKSKFWGKSMEIFPIGVVNVTIPKYSDHYRWKKVTSCIYNLLGSQRWVDHYGEMVITNEDQCSCRLTFVKASYWSSKKYEVHGDVYSASGEKVRHLYGTWTDAMFCGEKQDAAYCVWRAGPMPPHSDKYYGFSQFAMVLNELNSSNQQYLPITDSRFRPDQRLLEEGNLHEAEAEKHRVEQIQRQARAERERLGVNWSPLYFKQAETEDGQECWVYKGNYWTQRYGPGFTSDLPVLW